MALKDLAKDEAVEVEVEETPAATTEVAVSEPAAPPATTSPKSSVFISNPDFLDAVAGATYGMFQSVVASNGTHQAGDLDLGKTLKFQAIVANEVKKITPGSNDEEAKEYFAVSEDGIKVGDGRLLDDALQDAIDAGYDKAAIKKYIDVIALVVECDNDDFVGETITLQLSPSSQFTWRPLEGKCKMKAALGRLAAEPIAGNPELGSAVVFTSVATPTKWKGNSFTKFVFSI